jgi:hypothetical protein
MRGRREVSPTSWTSGLAHALMERGVAGALMERGVARALNKDRM